MAFAFALRLKHLLSTTHNALSLSLSRSFDFDLFVNLSLIFDYLFNVHFHQSKVQLAFMRLRTHSVYSICLRSRLCTSLHSTTSQHNFTLNFTFTPPQTQWLIPSTPPQPLSLTTKPMSTWATQRQFQKPAMLPTTTSRSPVLARPITHSHSPRVVRMRTTRSQSDRPTLTS